jgi:hypothetical protein
MAPITNPSATTTKKTLASFPIDSSSTTLERSHE